MTAPTIFSVGPALATAFLRVSRIDPHTDPRWLGLVQSHPQATIYHHPYWIRAIEEEYGQPSAHLACEDGDGRLLAILPLLETRGLPFNIGGHQTGRRLTSLPRTPLGGPLSSDPEATAAILAEAVARAGTAGVPLQIKSAGQELDGIAAGLICTPWRLTYLLSLPESPKAFRIPDSQERTKIKWAVNKAAKLGVTIRGAETEQDLRAWYGVYLETMRRGVIPPRPYRFFESLWRSLQPGGMMQLLLAEYPGADHFGIIGGALFFQFGGTISYAFSALQRKHATLRPIDAIQWRAIHDACQHGFRTFDFGEVPEGNSELARFKSKWGAEPHRLYRYYAPAEKIEPADKAGTGSRLRSALEAAWRRLPLSMTAWLGDRIYSRL